ncbi:pirin family protein [Marinobacteraceae bacterium S3BR75-40.1]
MTYRQITQLIPSRPASDGAGVKLLRNLGQTQAVRLDPFLMLDEFRSDQPEDYLAGFPPHPHRGFETVTYMLAGAMRHEDSLGNRGHLRAGDVQWMTAGAGIIHAEMPEQENGLMHGFQLWINLPAREKMATPQYRDIPAAQIPVVALQGGEVRVIAGDLTLAGQPVRGAVSGISRQPLYLDVALEAGATFGTSLPATHNVLVYVFEGEVILGGRTVASGHSAVLGEGDGVHVEAGTAGGRFLLLAAEPIGEPIAQYGPFVMNNPAEIEQALEDYRHGRLAHQPEVH